MNILHLSLQNVGTTAAITTGQRVSHMFVCAQRALSIAAVKPKLGCILCAFRDKAAVTCCV
jgi:hypothetical protein